MEGSVTDVKQYDSRARGAWEIFSSRTNFFLFVNGMTGGRGMCHNAIFDVPSFSQVRTIKYRYYKILMIGLDEPIYTLKFLTTNVSRKHNTQVIHIERQFSNEALTLRSTRSAKTERWMLWADIGGQFQTRLLRRRIFYVRSSISIEVSRDFVIVSRTWLPWICAMYPSCDL
jgi:hypothetical protein